MLRLLDLIAFSERTSTVEASNQVHGKGLTKDTRTIPDCYHAARQRDGGHQQCGRSMPKAQDLAAIKKLVERGVPQLLNDGE